VAQGVSAPTLSAPAFRLPWLRLFSSCRQWYDWSNRKITDGQRTVAAIRGFEGKRLAYKKGA